MKRLGKENSDKYLLMQVFKNLLVSVYLEGGLLQNECGMPSGYVAIPEVSEPRCQ